jgi:transposase-like protein
MPVCFAFIFCSITWHSLLILYLSETRDREVAKTFLQKALSNPDNRTPRLLCMAGAGSTRQRFEICEPKGVYRSGVDEEPNDTPTIELNRTTGTSSGDSVPCKAHGWC